MPRSRRTAAPEAAPEETAAGAAPAATPPDDAPKPGAEAASAETPAKPRRRRASAKPPVTNQTAPEPASAPENALSPAPPDVEAPVAEGDAPAVAPAAKRPGGRRRKTVETAPSDDAAAPEPEIAAPPAEASARPRRGRARKADAATDETTPISVESVAEGTPQEEQPPAAPAPPADAGEAGTRRRPGGRRTRHETQVSLVSPPAEELPDVEAPVAEAEATPTANEAAPARRRRSRRRGAPLPATDQTPAETPAAAEASAEAVTEEPTAEDEAGKTEEEGGRSRRSRRRSRRRRNGEVEVPVDLSESPDGGLVPEPEPVASEAGEEEDEDDGALALIAPAPPVYVAPPLVPPVLAPAAGSPLPGVRASVQPPTGGGGLAQIVVNGQAHLPYLFFVNAEAATDGGVVDSQLRQASQAGTALFSGVMHLPLRNAYGDRSFGATDALLQQILDAAPNAYILPRLQFFPTNFWARTHPDQMARYADGNEGDVSLASTEFWADCVDALEALIAHLADPATPGGDRVIGFHLDRGEWFYDQAAGYDLSEPNRLAFQNWLRAKYQFAYALRAAWFDGAVTFDDAAIPAWPGATAQVGETPLYSGPRDGRWPDYAAFASELVAQAITGLASAVKTLSDGRLLVGVSYGYTLEFATRNDSGHLALAQVLESPDIDILAGPNSYTGRGAGGAGAFGAPVDSVGLRGKLWLVEDDTKTFLAAEDTPDDYNPKIANGADTRAAHERHFGAALAHRAGVTWMDLWGQGWLDSPDIWRELGRLRDQADRLGRISKTPRPAPDVAVLVDEASLAYLKNSPAGLGQALIGKSRDLLLRSGASVGFYLQSDVRRDDFPDATLYLFLNALRLTTEERRAIRERLQRAGKTLAWLYAPGIFDEHGLAEQEVGDTVGIALRQQPWNARLGSQLTEARSPLTDRLRSGKRPVGQDEVLNPSLAAVDPQATVLAEYAGAGGASMAVREHPGGWKAVFLGDPHLSAELLRGLYAYAGVPVYETQDDVVYASDGVLLVHAPFTGQRSFSLPRRAAIYDVAEDRLLAADTKTFRAFLRARTTRLFLWGDGEALADATGLPLPAAGAAQPEMPPETGEAADEPPQRVPPPLRRRSAPPTELSGAAGVETEEVTLSVTGAPAGADDLETALDVLEEAVQPLLEGDAAEGEDQEGGEGETAGSARRSRWQRRRAAMRARRDAERQARQGADGAPDGGAANAPVDIAALLPGLPPRRPATDDE